MPPPALMRFIDFRALPVGINVAEFTGATAVRLLVCAACVALAACDGVQSSLTPAGREAERIADLFWWMTGGALLTWVLVVAIAIYFTRRPAERHRRRDSILIIGGGVIVPALVLTILLIYGLAMLPPTVARAPEGSLQVVVTGEQWWWRVQYSRPEGEVVLANEVRLPVGEPVQFQLISDNVIHSFWIPSIGGKMDMIPGRVTHLTLHPTATGTFRGVCAEFCGTAHALMAFYVQVLEPGDFEQWITRQAAPAAPPASALASHGETVFLASGCHACHTIRGTPADGEIGPDLTHVGSRLSLAAGILDNEPDAFLDWIARPDELKPGVHMPAFGMLPDADLQALAVYLEGLQ